MALQPSPAHLRAPEGRTHACDAHGTPRGGFFGVACAPCGAKTRQCCFFPFARAKHNGGCLRFCSWPALRLLCAGLQDLKSTFVDSSHKKSSGSKLTFGTFAGRPWGRSGVVSWIHHFVRRRVVEARHCGCVSTPPLLSSSAFLLTRCPPPCPCRSPARFPAPQWSWPASSNDLLVFNLYPKQDLCFFYTVVPPHPFKVRTQQGPSLPCRSALSTPLFSRHHPASPVNSFSPSSTKMATMFDTSGKIPALTSLRCAPLAPPPPSFPSA